MWGVFLLILSCAVCFISGNPIVGVSKDCSDYFYNVVGHHYVPNGKCLEEKQESIKSQLDDLKFTYGKSSREKRGLFNSDPLSNVMGLLNSNLNLRQNQSPNAMCSACKSAVAMMQFFIADGKSNEELVELGIDLCQNLNIMTPEVCDGLLKINGYALMTVLRNSTLTSGEMCNFFIAASCDESGDKKQWKVELPESRQSKSLDVQMPVEDAPRLKVLHISDIHFDPYYVENTLAECKLPLCCRAENGEPTPNATMSGKWGGWKCDTPKRTLENLFEHLAEEHSDVDYIVWTGDLPPHDSWSFYRNDSISVLNETVSMFTKYFPNTPCYPALGNHEAVPPNLFPTTEVADEFKINWLYDELADQWSKWLPENATDLIRRGAFYSVLVRPGFRIVSLNMNYCYSNNWWLILNNEDPLDELQWLIEVLQSAEDNNEKVHIIGHVPPGHSDCIKAWQKNYYDIVNRFQDTITAQFFGHTHNDEFLLFYDKEDNERAIGVAYIIPSVTTYTYLNPGYKIAYVDGDHEKTTRHVLDHETYILDLEEANRSDNPIWKKLYSAKEAYNMTSLMPSDWKSLLDRIATDNNVLDLYHKHYWKDAPKRPKCDEDCRKELICLIRSCSQYGEYNVKKNG